jgi:uncharacterized protein
MFIEFQVGNFRSFRDIQKFTMQAAPLRTNDNGDEEGNVFISSDIRLLKSKAIYGSNASGKSNLTLAFDKFVYMVVHSVSIENIPKMIWNDSFKLISDWENEPIFFQFIFSVNDKIYRYGFQILKEKVFYEWLFEVKGDKENEYLMRSSTDYSINKNNFVGTDSFIEQASNGKSELFREDALFLTAAALSGNSIAAEIRNMFRGIIIVDGINDENAANFGVDVLENGTEKEKNALMNLMNVADTGIERLSLVEINEKKGNNDEKSLSLFSSHFKYDENGKINEEILVPFKKWESEGTIKLFGIGSIVLESLEKGRTLIIDEFDARFHPNLTLKIVELYNSSKTNPKNAQLIFVTHDTGLLRRAELRRDQICLVNKDKYGISTLRTLVEFKGVRKDASYEKEYLNGNYEAVPFLDKMDNIIIQNLENDGL